MVVPPKRLRRRHDAMRTARGSKTVRAIFIGRWTPVILFSLKGHRELRVHFTAKWRRCLQRTMIARSE
jgi:hypothetical protein